MNNPGNGKIAKLPPQIREQLNRRLQTGEQGRTLVEWLNSIPEVRAIIAQEFAGKQIREQNLSEWRKRGYREWHEQHQTVETIRSVITGTTELQQTRAKIADNIAVWLAARYFTAIKNLDDQEHGLDLRRMRQFCDDLVKLRRGDHTCVRLDLTSKEQQARSKRMAIKHLKTLEQNSNISPKAKALFAQFTAEIAAHRNNNLQHPPKAPAFPAGASPQL
ncbi:MAG: hypothetical protein WCD79_17145 [Chthoniobacteraceae bacterium]